MIERSGKNGLHAVQTVTKRADKGRLSRKAVKTKMQIKESAENYLEAILMIQIKKGHVRSIDVANELSFTKPSVSVAMKGFREEGYITMDDTGGICLTPKGLAIAQKVYERHQVIAKGLMALGVDEKRAYEDSCKIEHDLSNESFDKIKEHLTRHGIID